MVHNISETMTSVLSHIKLSWPAKTDHIKNVVGQKSSIYEAAAESIK